MICLIRGGWLKNTNKGNVPVTGTFFIETDCVEIPVSLSYNAENSKSNIIILGL